MDVSVIIVNYNTCRMTADCIESVRQKTSGISYEIILVDNGSTDGSKEFFEEFEGIKYIYSDENLGFGRANNLGAKQASGDYLFLLNSDTLLINNAIKILYDYINTHQSVGVVGGNLVGLDSTERISFERVFPGIYHTLNQYSKGVLNRLRFGKDVHYNHLVKPLKVAYISGADLMIRKSLFENIGGFDPVFFMYYEETELCYRVQSNHCHVVSVPDAMIVHMEGGTVEKQTDLGLQKTAMSFRSRELFIRLIHGEIYCYIDRLLMSLLLKLISIVKRNRRDKEVYGIYTTISKK